jgi:hypothetical protein
VNLITGISGTGKTELGNILVKDFGFVHLDLEDANTLNRLFANPTQFIGDIVSQDRDSVVTWGFNPEHQPSVSSVLQFKTSGFKLLWFDGNRPAALRAFTEACFIYVDFPCPKDHNPPESPLRRAVSSPLGSATPPEAIGYSPWSGIEPNRKKNIGPRS